MSLGDRMDVQENQLIWLSSEEVDIDTAIAKRDKRIQDQMENNANKAEQKLRDTFKNVELVTTCEQYAIKVNGEKFGESWTIAEAWVNALDEICEVFKEGQAAVEWIDEYFKGTHNDTDTDADADADNEADNEADTVPLKCDSCEKEKPDVDWQRDPYMYELYANEELSLLCDDCVYRKAMDV